MSEDSLDIYIRSLVLEATRLDCRKITIVQGQGRPQITFVAEEESMEFPHPPKENPQQLIPRLRSLAGLGEGAGAAEEKGKATIPRRDRNIELGVTFSQGAGGTTATIEILSDVAVSHL